MGLAVVEPHLVDQLDGSVFGDRIGRFGTDQRQILRGNGDIAADVRQIPVDHGIDGTVGHFDLHPVSQQAADRNIFIGACLIQQIEGRAVHFHDFKALICQSGIVRHGYQKDLTFFHVVHQRDGVIRSGAAVTDGDPVSQYISGCHRSFLRQNGLTGVNRFGQGEVAVNGVIPAPAGDGFSIKRIGIGVKIDP